MAGAQRKVYWKEQRTDRTLRAFMSGQAYAGRYCKTALLTYEKKRLGTLNVNDIPRHFRY